MILYKSRANEQNAYTRNPGKIPYQSWKNNTNNVIVAKNVKNSNLSVDINSNCSNSCFKAQPIKHYRRQLTDLGNQSKTDSNYSFIGNLDKPGNNIITQNTSLNCNNNELLTQTIHIMNKHIDCNLDPSICIHPQSLILKSANTNLTKEYSTSNKEFLYKRCKTFEQNTKQYSIIDTSGVNYFKTKNSNIPCIDSSINCINTIGYSNAKYKVQGPISSSARTAALKYNSARFNQKTFYIENTDYNVFGKTENFENKHQCRPLRCINNNRFNINILK